MILLVPRYTFFNFTYQITYFLQLFIKILLFIFSFPVPYMHIFFLKTYILHLLEKTSPPFILYLDFTVRKTGPLNVPEDSMCFQGACFRNELTSSKIKNKLGFFHHVSLQNYNFSFTSSSYQTTYLWHTGEGCDQPNRFAKHRMEQQHWEPTKACFFLCLRIVENWERRLSNTFVRSCEIW